VADEFVRFYLEFVLQHKRAIQSGAGINLFRNKLRLELASWLGLAFESYVVNNAIYFAELAGFADKVESYGSFSSRDRSVQCDLIYKRTDETITVCEVKFQQEEVSVAVVPKFQEMLKKLPIKRGQSVQKMLIAPGGVSKAIGELEYFDTVVVDSLVG
jgi:hypothetical protein